MSQAPLTVDSHRCALITGASSGIGKATAIALAEVGFDLVLMGRSTERLATVAEAVTPFGVTAKIYPIDLKQVDGLREKIVTIAAEHPHLDVLVNSAGISYVEPLSTISAANWQELFDVNVTAVLQCIQGVLPGMRQRGGGTIVNIVSIAAKQVFPDWGGYCATKAALLSLTRSLAVEERSNGIRAIAILPGAVATPIWDTIAGGENFDKTRMISSETVADAILHAVRAPVNTTIEEVVIMPSAGTL